MKQVQDVVERLWDFIDTLDINTFGRFLADNIVGSVVAFSLLFWVPFSILVHCVVGLLIVLARLSVFCKNSWVEVFQVPAVRGQAKSRQNSSCVSGHCASHRQD